jgi:hypothetical protein
MQGFHPHYSSILTLSDCHLLSRAKNSGRQCHFKIWLDCHKFKKKSLSDYAHIKKVSKKIRKKNDNDMMIGYNIYDRFTVEHFPLLQSIILTTSFFCSRQYFIYKFL